MAEIVLSFVVEQSLERLLSLITGEISLLWNLNDDLKDLQHSLTMIRAVLQDAEQQQTKREPLKLWLNKLKQIAYDAEDLFDKLAYENLRLKVETEPDVRSSNPFSKVSLSAKRNYFKIKVAHKVKNVNESLSKIKNEAVGFGLQALSGGNSTNSIYLDRVTDSVLDSPIVGREADVSRIVNLLGCSSEQQLLTIVSLVGMGGLGKTSVAKLVCQEVMSKNLFDVKIWICVSDNCSDQRILGEMLQCLRRDMGGLTNKDAIVNQLREELERKKFLLVLDDVWDDASKWWDDLKTRLLTIVKNNGSAILLTTRKEDVASIVETSHHHRHNLDCLSDGQCWSVIKNKVVGNRGTSIPDDLEVIGHEIATKCRGVPLAAKVLGGTLSSLKLEEEEWLSILNDRVLNASDNRGSVEAILKLSFDHLPSYLKQCFAYCSMFPKDYLIDKEDLIQLWMAEGFVEPCNGDVSGKYFNALVCNSFFQDVERDEDENIVSCKMHDLVHDLAISLSKSDILAFENSSAEVDLSCIRRVNLDCQYALNSMAVYAAKLRTVFLSEKNVFDESWKLKSLRTLKLRGAPIKKLPSQIGECKRLRYIDVSNTEIEALPESITKLYSLQTLKFQECSMLGELPRERIKYLVNLKHIEFSKDEQVPSGLGRLTNLERLPLFVVGSDRGGSIEELKCLNELRGELVIKNLEKVRDEEEARKANLKSKKKITALKFYWSRRQEKEDLNDEEVLEGLEPHPSIKRVEIAGYMGGNFPEWVLKMKVANCFTLLNNLVELKLFGCWYCEQVPSLGNLPSLKYLDMSIMAKVRGIGNEFYDIESGGRRLFFPSLKCFCLFDLYGLVEWMAPQVDEKVAAVFPCLEELSIKNCQVLAKIPMRHLSSLVKLDISSCRMLEYVFDEVQTFPGLKSLGISWSNITHLPSALGSFICLEGLRISACHSLKGIPKALGKLNSLISLEIMECRGLGEFPGEILGSLTGLKKLMVGGFSEELNANLCYLNSIQHLSSSLHELSIWYGTATCLPDQLQHLTSLKSLKINEFNQLEALPEWLGRLSSLESLFLSHCDHLKNLPSAATMKRLSKLTVVEIKHCSNLRENSPEIGKISHIDRVHVSYKGKVRKNEGNI